MVRIGMLSLILASSWNCLGFAAAPELKAIIENRSAPDDISEPIKALLSEQALRVDDATGEFAIIWFRAEIPATATADQVKNGLTYREIPVSTVIGAIQLTRPWIDFRKQEIPKGVYTLRLATQPMDGDHMGTAPHTDFCLLCPASNDPKPDTMDVKSLRELSASAHGSTHPAVMLLFPNSRPENGATIVNKGNKIFVLNVARPVLAGSQKTTLGFGLTVAGHTTE